MRNVLPRVSKIVQMAHGDIFQPKIACMAEYVVFSAEYLFRRFPGKPSVGVVSGHNKRHILRRILLRKGRVINRRHGRDMARQPHLLNESGHLRIRIPRHFPGVLFDDCTVFLTR